MPYPAYLYVNEASVIFIQLYNYTEPVLQSPPNAVMLLSRSRRYRTQRGLLVPLTPSTDPPTRAATPSLISGQLMHSRLLRSTSRGKPVHVFTEVAGSTNHLNAWYGVITVLLPSLVFPLISELPFRPSVSMLFFFPYFSLFFLCIPVVLT